MNADQPSTQYKSNANTPAVAKPLPWQIIAAVARKDLLDVANNRPLLLVMNLPVLILVVFRLLLQAGLSDPGILIVSIYDPGHSQLTPALQNLPEISLKSITSEIQLQASSSSPFQPGFLNCNSRNLWENLFS